ncbi:dynamin family protein [Campylobacter sputorum]|uniref:dynamin family protein n=1 Tax=Campylobacter sputorum TaxID=206 RepID=UPI000B771E26|nr:dynamin family protein [Campylobacter sputorum]ASM36478.1 GTP-binding protein (dynamin domain) [Campylobacter sputorum bv. faecalis CCUG 20703]
MDAFLSEIWGINKLYIDNLVELSFNSKDSAVLLSCSDGNYDRYLSLKSFCAILKNSNLKTNLYDIQFAQIGIINSIKNLKISRSEVILNLKQLYENGIISIDYLDKITHFLKSLKLINDENIFKFTQKSDIFHNNISVLNECFYEMKNITKNKNLINLLENAFKNANQAQFFISVTGIINAGKSTMLNSLLDFNVLGTANIPETANLSFLKFSNESYAKVKFWNENELKELGFENAQARQDLCVSIDELKNYTTAKENISKFVKMVEIGVCADILKDGICIVDTPGLDDAIVLREELTKKFMHESDFVIHLMNAAQSVTKKDISFVKNFLAYGKANNFMIVLTHIDLLDKYELNDVIKYTKDSVTKELQDDGYDLSLVNNIKFFAINGINKNGIEDIKNYLYTMLFGEKSLKSNMILSNYKKELNNVISYIKDELEREFSMMSCDDVKFSEEILQLEQETDILKNDINQVNLLLNENLKKLDYSNLSAFSHIKNISIILKDRVISDIQYANKNRKKVDFDRIFNIVKGGFDDLLLDLFRDIKFNVSKDMENISKQISLKINSFDDSKIGFFDIKNYLDENFRKPDYILLNSKLSSIIKTKSSNMQNDIQNLFDEFLSFLDIKKSLLKLIDNYTKDFKIYFENAINIKKNFLEEKILLLKDRISNINNTSKNSLYDMQKIKQNLDLINMLSTRINGC